MRVLLSKCSMIYLVLSLALFLPPSAQASTPVTLTDVNAEYLLGIHLEMLRDPSGTLTIDDVSSPESSRRFVPVTSERPNLGYTRDAIWYRFTVLNSTSEPDWVLNAGREWIEEVTLYTRGAHGKWERLETGARLPHLKKPLVSEHPILPIHQSSGASSVRYLRIRCEYTSLSLLLRLIAKDRFAFDDAMEKLYYGGFYAVLVIMALYNLILAISLREALFAKLAASLIFYSIGESGAHGHLAFLFLPSSPMIGQQTGLVAFALMGVCVGLFGVDMLDTKRHVPRHHIISIIIIYGYLALSIAASVTLRAHEAVFLCLALGAVNTIILGMRRFADRDRAAAFFTIALLSWLTPAVFQAGAILGLLPLFAATEHGAHIGGVIMSILLSLGVAEQVNRVNRASQRFLPKPFLGRLGHASIADVNLGDSIEAEMTVLFSDIRNFTTRSEQLSPSETFAFLNTYLARMVPAIEKHGGLIDKYIGDAIMALFPDSTDKALAAAVAMQEAVCRLNDARPEGQEPISIGIGLHRGRLMLGTVGDKNRLDVTVISDAVNVASRLESLTKEKGEAIIVSSDVVRALKNPESFSLKQLGITSIKGRVNAVEIWAVKADSGLMV